MTNGTSQGLFIVIAIIIFGLFIFVSYLLFNDILKPSLSGIFNDSLEQSTDNLSGVTNPKYLNFSTTNGNGINGLTSNAYNEDGSIKKNLKTLILPNTINSRDLVTIDFMNSNITGTSTSRFAGVEKIVGNSKLTKVTPILTYTEVKELDLSQTQVTDIGQSFLKDNKTIKKLTLGKQFSNFGYAPFQNSALEEQLRSYESRLKKVNYY